ncbi:MAG: hypothetical protein ABI591_30475 [Kofleriaceae bacterium]
MKKWLAAAPALLLVMISLWEVVAVRCDAGSAPEDDEWESAAQVVRESYHPGELIVFAPDWADPIGRLHLGDLIPVAMAARMDAAKYGAIWELSIRGAHAPEVAGLAPKTETHVGGVTLRYFERTPVVVVSDVLDHVAELRSDGARPTLELAEVGFAPHRCLQIVPPAHGVVTITVPMQLGTKLVGYVGLADVFKRRDIRTPGELEVHAGTVTTDVKPGVDDGWVRFELATVPGASEVTFIAKAVSPDRLICFAAEARQ